MKFLKKDFLPTEKFPVIIYGGSQRNYIQKYLPKAFI